MKQNPQPTLRNLASHAGVSVATVSRILNRGEMDLFSPDTVERVFQSAASMGYRPNLLMRGVLTGKTKTVGVMVPGSGLFYPRVVEGIHDELSARDYAVLLSWNKETMPDLKSDNELRLIHRMVDRRVDGIILRPTHDEVSDVYFREVWERGIPLVTVDRELQGVHCGFVGTDDEAGGRAAAEHLLSLGHRHLGHLAGPMQVSTARDRRRGFEETVKESGLGATCMTIEAASFHKVYPEALRILQERPQVTAIFCHSDEAAVEVYKAAAELGLSIPGDLSVVGFADLPQADYLQPGLTTVRQDPYGIGRLAAKRMLDYLESDRKSTWDDKIRLKPELTLRGSTCPP